MWTLRDRISDPTTSYCEENVSKDDFPLALVAPAPPFALGKVLALLTRDANPRLLRAADELAGALRDVLASHDRCQCDTCSKVRNLLASIGTGGE